MQIVQVDLENVKSYAEASVTFTQGINAICGQNGAGKSTLLEAVGFALFDYLPVNRDEFVREGERTATVTVHLVGADERLYQVVRKCGGSNQIYVYDPELECKLAEGKHDVSDWLHDTLGVDETTDLTALFRDAVGVPQGLFTAAFLETPVRRREVFNPLLRVDEYEHAWETLRGAKGWLEHVLQEYGERIAGLEAETRILPQRESDIAALTQALAAEVARQVEGERDLAKLAERKTALEAAKVQLDHLEQAVLQVVGERKVLTARLAEARGALDRAMVAQAVVAESKDGERAYLTARTEQTALEAQRQDRDAIQTERLQVEKSLAQVQTQLQGCAAELVTIAQAEANRAALQPQVAEQERIEAALAEARRAADRLVGARQILDEAETHLSGLQQRLEQTRVGVAERAQVETRLTEARAALAPLEVEHTQNGQALAAQQAELKGLAGQQKQAESRRRQAQRDLSREQARLDESEVRLKEVQAGVAQRTQVEEESIAVRGSLDALEARRIELTEMIAGHRAALAQLEIQHRVLTETESGRCPVCEAPLTPDHRTTLLEHQQARQAEEECALVEAQAEQQTVEKVRRKQEKALRALEERLKSLPRPDEAQVLERQIADQRQVCTECEGAVVQAQAEIADLQTRQIDLGDKIAEVQVQQEALSASLTVRHQECDELERRLRSLPRPADIEDLVGQCARQEAIVTEKVRIVDELHDAPEEVSRWEETLAALGDPRRAYQRADGVAGRRSGVEQRQSDAETRRVELSTAVAEYTQVLAAYTGLDDRLVAAQAALVTHEPAHRRYLEHIREAESLPERQEAVTGLTAEVAAADAAYTEKVTARDSAAQEYDAGTYVDVTTRHAALGQELAGLTARMGEQLKQQAQLQSEIARLHEVQASLDAARTEQAEHRDLLSLLDYLRGVLRAAGPEITRKLVEVISLQADRLYADIMQDYSARLCWTDDYDIVLKAENRTRSFQQLSGGEQMAAALAVRLALLREVSAIDVAFFDEPTANLDRDRRANLAAQIINIKGFSQLFVISHDDTFEQDMDHVVRVVKHGGTSGTSPEAGEWGRIFDRDQVIAALKV